MSRALRSARIRFGSARLSMVCRLSTSSSFREIILHRNKNVDLVKLKKYRLLIELPLDLIQFFLVPDDHLVTLHKAQILDVALRELVLVVDVLFLQLPQHSLSGSHGLQGKSSVKRFEAPNHNPQQLTVCFCCR